MTTVLDALKRKVLEGSSTHAAGLVITVNEISCREHWPPKASIGVHVCGDHGEPLVKIGSFTLFNGDSARILDIDRAFDIRISS